jgi:protein-tyrosine kinase
VSALVKGRVPLAPAAGVAPRSGERSIGAILIDTGQLTPAGAESILRLQREQGLRFGEAAIQLGLIAQADIDLALSRQFDYPYLLRGQSAVSEEVVTAYAPFTPQVEAMRALRSQLMLRWFATDAEHKALAIVSAERNEGRSFLAANLAVVFSQLGEHTLLIDADMRNPSQHRLFGLDNRAGLSALLSGRGGPDAVQRIASLRDLAVLPAGAQPPNPSELLGGPVFAQMLRDLAREFDVILLDTPAAGSSADAQTVTMRAGAALIVVRKDATRLRQVQGVADHALQTNTVIVGTVLNDF